jgi:hypothetical protein
MGILEHYLSKFARLIDPLREERIAQLYQQVFRWEHVERLPFCWSDMPPVADQDWPDYSYNETFVDREKMLLSQLRPAYFHYTTGDDYPLAIRANYGTVILPSVLGARWQLTDNSLPWAHHLEGRDAIKKVIDAGIPSPRAGLGTACLETASYYREVLSSYPELASAIHVYHPDLQGPFDVAHLLWGPDIFLAFYDCPELVHKLLDLVTQTYISWLTHWKEVVGEENTWTVHWNIWQRGGVMLRDDTAVLLSASQYREFIQPYDQQVLDVFGGCIHFCGRGDHFVTEMVKSQKLYGLNITQPELNDMEKIWDLCQARRIVLLDLNEHYLPEEVKTGVSLRRSWIASQEANVQ